MADVKGSNNGVYWFIGITVVGFGGYLIAKKWYDDQVASNPAFTFYNWFNSNFK